MACEFTLRLSMEVCVKQNKNIVQGSLFEDDYLMRTLGNIARDSDYALTELVANAWDAGATEVKITIPTQAQDIIRISDNGHGMTSSEFKRRWMMLGYKRIKHQGRDVEFPPGVDGGERLAYGRNGIGRHAMLCFADKYVVKTLSTGQKIDNLPPYNKIEVLEVRC
jgi:HSP90 family molecular chaperone